MTTDAGSFKSYQLIEGRTTPVSVRVSPAEKIRAEIDALFDGQRELGEVIEDVARLGARLIIQTALEAGVEVFLGRARYQRAAGVEGAVSGMRNGYCPATVKTTAGPVTVARPKLRGTTEAFASRLFGKSITKSNALESLVIAGFVRGLSVRDVENTLADALGAEAALSKSTVSRICQAIGDEFTAWSSRRLDGLQLDYLFLDASMFKMHPGARAEPVLAAWGITTDGKPAFVALAAGGSESADARGQFPRRAPRPGLAPAAAGHLRRRRRADQRRRVGFWPGHCGRNGLATCSPKSRPPPGARSGTPTGRSSTPMPSPPQAPGPGTSSSPRCRPASTRSPRPTASSAPQPSSASSRGWRGVNTTSTGLRLLHDLRRQLLDPPTPIRRTGQPAAQPEETVSAVA